MSAVCAVSLLTSGVRDLWPTNLRLRPSFIRCRGGCGMLSSRLGAYTLPRLRPCSHRIAICPSTTSRPPPPLWPPSHSPSVSLLPLHPRFASLFAPASWLSITVLTSGSSSVWCQHMISASRPRSCSFLMTLHIGAPDVGWLYVSFCFDPSHALAGLAVNCCCLESRTTGACVSHESLMRGPSGVVGRAPTVDLAWRFRRS